VETTVRRLIIGCGYLGERVARDWREVGDDVWALTRSVDHAARFQQLGITPLLGDVLDPGSLSALPEVDTVLHAVGHDRSAPAAKREVYVNGLANVLKALPADCRRLIYISSTSVYGQSRGEWIDENSPCEPTTDGGRICRDAEQVARDLFRGAERVSVLRLSGIYGPGRLAARVESLRQQQPIAGRPDGWINLIHVDDVRHIVQTCAMLPTPVETLLVTDDRPLRRRDYYVQLAAALGVPEPAFFDEEELELGKRCSNRLLREELGVKLTFATFAAGLPSAIEGRLRR
jgi:nucleoside-diphosphate-sugar epimerase